MSFTVKNSGFDLVYTLTQNQIATTITADPTGVYFLRDLTDEVNLGNNTLQQDDYPNINVSIENGIKLYFLNRYVPSVGAKQLQVQFYSPATNGVINVSDIIPYNASVLTAPYQKQNVQWYITENTRYFDYTYTLTDSDIESTINNPNIAQYQGKGFFIYDSTNQRVLGNNSISTIGNFTNMFVEPVNRVLTFPNRCVFSNGVIALKLVYWAGAGMLYVKEYTFNAVALDIQSTYQFTTRAPAFDLTYTLTPNQIADTFTRFPNGIYYLNDVTDGLNLGNGSNIPNQDYSNINVSITNQNQLVFQNRTPPSIGVKNFRIGFYVGYFDGNFGYPISENIAYEALAASNVCFTGDTPITTDQGNIPISLIQPEVHTIQKKKIVAITKTINDDYLVCFEKDALYPNVPSQRTVMTKTHRLFYKGRFIHARDFLGMERVTKIEDNGEPVYNVLMEECGHVLVNHLICETLNPQNKIAKLFTEGASLSEYASYYETRKKEFERLSISLACF